MFVRPTLEAVMTSKLILLETEEFVVRDGLL
jgi:hypothetical protein